RFPGSTDRTIIYMVPGHIFTQTGVLHGFDHGRVNCIAETPVVVYRDSKHVSLHAIQSNHDLHRAYHDILQRHTTCLPNRIAVQGVKGITAQCAHWLRFMSQYYGAGEGERREIVIPLTQTDIAEMMFVTRESANVALQEFIHKKVIHFARKRLTILDISKLEKMAAKI